MDITGNTILITGGTSGIGLALAKLLKSSGNAVFVAARRTERLEIVRHETGILGIACDINKQDDREKLLEYAKEKRVNMFISNAGIQRDVDFTKGTRDMLNPSELETNLEASVLLCAMFVPYLMTMKKAAIFTVTTGLIYMNEVRPNVPMYLASKAGIHQFTRHMRTQVEQYGIKVVEIVPPIVDTEINPEGRSLRKMASNGISPDVFAGYVFEGMKNDQSVIFARDEDYPRPLVLRGLI